MDVQQQKVKESYRVYCKQTESGCQSWDIPQAMQQKDLFPKQMTRWIERKKREMCWFNQSKDLDMTNLLLACVVSLLSHRLVN